MTKTTVGAVVDQRIVKALGHPLRQRILQVLHERVASPNEIAQELEEPLGNVSYHVRILRENECIELVRTGQVRGAIEHFYRATARPFFDDSHWAQLPVASRRSIFGQNLELIWNDVSAALGEGGFDRVETHVSRIPLDLDAEAYARLTEMLAELVDNAIALEAESAGRLVELPEDDRQTTRTELAMMHFDRPSAESAPAAGKGRRRRRRS